LNIGNGKKIESAEKFAVRSVHVASAAAGRKIEEIWMRDRVRLPGSRNQSKGAKWFCLKKCFDRLDSHNCILLDFDETENSFV
jgi:hypothetical protein